MYLLILVLLVKLKVMKVKKSMSQNLTDNKF